jgi:putative addiction module component (TIGR02574 family)
MHGMKEIIEEAECLPIEERLMVIDSLLRTINAPTTEIDFEWIEVAKRRLAELRSGRTTAVPGDEVFARIRNRFEK